LKKLIFEVRKTEIIQSYATFKMTESTHCTTKIYNTLSSTSCDRPKYVSKDSTHLMTSTTKSAVIINTTLLLSQSTV